MRNVFLILMSLSLSANVFAGIFNCDPLKDSTGSVLPGDAIYAVSVDLPIQNVILQIVSGTDEGGASKTTEIAMKPSSQGSSEGAIYDTDGIEAVISVAPSMPGMPSIFVNIRENIGSTIYSAACK